MKLESESIGIDFGGTSIKIGVVKGEEIIHESPRINPQGHTSANELIAILAETVTNLIKIFPNVSSVGIGVPGFVDFPAGVVHNLTNVKGWRNIRLADEMEELTGLPCTVENDANCMTIAEWKRGAGRGYENLICLTLGTGVGGGVIANNQIIRGANYVAGELGQMSIDYQGVSGNYDNQGALEKYIGNNQIAAFAQKEYANKGIEKTLEECFPHYLSDYAKNGCEVALYCWDQVAKKLATSLASTCWLLNPKAIVIGGGVSNAGSYLFDPLKRHLFNQLSEPFKDNLEIIKAAFGNEAGMIGAAVVATQR